MAVLDVDEAEASLTGHRSGVNETLDNRLDLLVAEHRVVGRQPESAIEERVAVEDAGLAAPVRVGPGETSRVRQLKPHEQAVVRPEGPSVRISQGLPQFSKRGEVGPVDQQLVWVGAPLVLDRHGLTTPN